MRNIVARWLVRYVSIALDRAYHHDQVWGDKTSAELWNRSFRAREKYVLPIALKLDFHNAAEQMALEGWWG